MSADPSANAPKKTPLHDVHQDLGANLVDFAGYLMPLRYASETAEHQAVRTGAGLFDLSHMGEIFLSGPGAADALDHALVGNLSPMAVGKARYTMICDADGGVLDDLSVYRLADETWMVVANAANAAVVRDALVERAAGFEAAVDDRSDAYALIALQGPRSQAILEGFTGAPPDVTTWYPFRGARRPRATSPTSLRPAGVCACAARAAFPTKSTALSSLTTRPRPASNGVVSVVSSLPYSGIPASSRSVSRADSPAGTTPSTAASAFHSATASDASTNSSKPSSPV
jgi:sarcosine oxidase gamma subunit